MLSIIIAGVHLTLTPFVHDAPATHQDVSYSAPVTTADVDGFTRTTRIHIEKGLA